uniref:Uncharacterized protein n=1 Tax=Anguilla anguilla TaxID=7936 RepID=A0A0E9WWW6_ANGAN
MCVYFHPRIRSVDILTEASLYSAPRDPENSFRLCTFELRRFIYIQTIPRLTPYHRLLTSLYDVSEGTRLTVV